MSNIKRVGVAILIVALIAIVGASFKGSNILDRAIILGLGVDVCEEGVQLTAEVVSPGNGTEQVGTFSKAITVTGRAIGEAMQELARQTGKEASLGQCVLLILGQEYYQTVDFADTTEYFIKHDSFKENATVCCCEGSAKDFLSNGGALGDSVSLAIATFMLQEADQVAVVDNDLLKFARSQSELHCTGFLNKVKFVPTENKDAQNPEQTLGYFSYDEVVIFNGNKYVCELNKAESQGMSLFFDKVVGDTFVSSADGLAKTLQVNDKKVDYKLSKDSVEITVTLSVRLGRTDSEEVSGPITAKKDKEIAPQVLNDVQKQAFDKANAFLEKQAEYNFDLIKLHELLRQRQGTSQSLAEKPTADFNVKLTVKVKEN